MRNRPEGSPPAGGAGTADGFLGFGNPLRVLSIFALQKAASGSFRAKREIAEGEKNRVSCFRKNR